ncbi:MAG: hypothetical protein H0V49_07880 [Nocardioidaceae bacterium]|nr:hypothetical protein [Nocardioidaceae bacterium]
MNESGHPTLDEISDLHAQVLEPHAAASVQGHVDRCADCADSLAALDAVSAELAGVGADLAAMPASVAADLDAVLERASAEREAGIPSLAARRAPDVSQPSRTASRRPKWILIGAAAAVAVIAIPTALNNLDLGSGSADQATAGSADNLSQRDADRPNASDEAEKGGGDGEANNLEEGGVTGSPTPADEADMVERLNRRNLAAFATRAEFAQDGPVQGSLLEIAARCATYRSFTSTDDERSFAAPVRWRGKRAVVLVDQAASSVSVFDCRTPTELLYSTDY